jgi:hypothetical protein
MPISNPASKSVSGRQRVTPSFDPTQAKANENGALRRR